MTLAQYITSGLCIFAGVSLVCVLIEWLTIGKKNQ